ncbi:hypothetical protein MTO96_018803 [Rhipicephalus appendiculatus]
MHDARNCRRVTSRTRAVAAVFTRAWVSCPPLRRECHVAPLRDRFYASDGAQGGGEGTGALKFCAGSDSDPGKCIHGCSFSAQKIGGWLGRVRGRDEPTSADYATASDAVDASLRAALR